MKITENIAGEAEQLLNEGLAQLDLILTGEQVRQLVLYCLELQKWSRKVNLVARNTSLLNLVDKHFLDSLTLVPLLSKFDCLHGSLLDVGSGAGFPGLVVKIACPSLAAVLLEPRHRRVSFLKHIIRLLALEKIDVQMHRTEDSDVLSAYDFTVITGRAVTDVAGFLAMVAQLASSKTLVICMQGVGGREEWEKNLNPTDFQCVGIEETVLPFSRAKRYLLLFRKRF